MEGKNKISVFPIWAWIFMIYGLALTSELFIQQNITGGSAFGIFLLIIGVWMIADKNKGGRIKFVLNIISVIINEIGNVLRKTLLFCGILLPFIFLFIIGVIIIAIIKWAFQTVF